MNPKVFIASSGKYFAVADALNASLYRRGVECELWTDGFFEPGNITHLALIRKAMLYDFAVFLITADDQLVSEKPLWVPRDNVIWELGLFTGVLGPERCFIVYQADKSPKLPSDLAGVTTINFKELPDAETGKTNWNNSMATSANTIAVAIEKLGARPKPIAMPDKLESELKRIRGSIEAAHSNSYYKRRAFQEGIHSRLRSLRQESADWTKGCVTVLPGYIDMLTGVYREAERNVFSTCIPAYLPLFRLPLGYAIMTAHRQNQNARVTRVFIFDRKGEEQPHLDILEAQKRAGITVLIYHDKDDDTFQFPPTNGHDWTVIDDGDVVGVTQKFGNEYEARWHFDDAEKKKEFQNLILELTKVSTVF